MSYLLIPIAPFSRTKSRLEDCFSKPQLKELTLAMFKDLCTTLTTVNCFDEVIIYSHDKEILDLASEQGLTGIKEPQILPRTEFHQVMSNLNNLAIHEKGAEQTILAFIDLILISAKNFIEFKSLLDINRVVVTPAIQSAGISLLGRTPPDVISTHCFSDPATTSFISLFNELTMNNIKDFAIYDSLRASFDVDVRHDLLLAHEYLRIFNLTETELFKFLKSNLKETLKKKNQENNRELL